MTWQKEPPACKTWSAVFLPTCTVVHGCSVAVKVTSASVNTQHHIGSVRFIKLDIIIMACWCIAPIVAVLYVLFDVNYFLRIAWTIGIARLFQKKIKVSDTSTIYGLCTTNDIDIFIRHMNNARYIRELDFARFDFYDRCGIYGAVTKSKAVALQGASNIRYRRTIPIFTPYKVTTKLLYWDDKAIYLEQQFVTISDNFVRAVALSKQNIVGVSVLEMLASLGGKDLVRPPMPEDLDHWLQAIELSSAKLRKTD